MWIQIKVRKNLQHKNSNSLLLTQNSQYDHKASS